MTHKYTDEQLTSAIKNSTSIRQALIKLGVIGEGGNYRVIHKAIKRLNIDVSHYTGQGWNKDKHLTLKPIEYYLVNNCPTIISSNDLKKRLLRENIFTPKCNICNLSLWLNKPISLELDHIDGVHTNNTLTNLRLLCPNCHAQTTNYRGRNIKRVN